MKEKYQYENFELAMVNPPLLDGSNRPIMLSDETMQERRQKVLDLMSKDNFDTLLIYGDLEHGSNFEYLCGFVPRFEEALLVLHRHGEAFLVLGNENLNKAGYARLKCTPIHAPHFSLPNQPMENKLSFIDILKLSGVNENMRVGVVGWKLFTSQVENNQQLYDVPYFIVHSLEKLIKSKPVNATALFISGAIGARVINNANEVAHYEFGSSLASDCILKTMDAIEVGLSEMEMGNFLQVYGQRPSVVTIAACGERFEKANLYPTDKRIQLSDKISLTIGYKGGLSSRSGYTVHDASELPKSNEDYLEKLVKPYFSAIVAWLENIHCGMKGCEIYDLIEEILPKNQFNWHLCPGHLCADEEWLSSPIYQNSTQILKSGMIFQTDIIPAISGYGGASAESTVLLADQSLRKSIEIEYPEMWMRMMKRRKYLKEELNIHLSEDVLPMASTLAYLRPYLLSPQKAMKRK